MKINTIEEARHKVRQTVIVALDLASKAEALELVDVLDGRIAHFKVGHRLYTRYGPALLDECADRGVKIFLDLKLYDIPSVVGDACATIAGHEAVFMTTVHASGGAQMLRAAAEGVNSGADAGDRPAVLAVTALTSFSSESLPEIGVGMGVEKWAMRLGDLAIECGVDGLVSSTREVAGLRVAHGKAPLLVTPGIRLAGVHIAGDDQERIDSPRAALRAGSSMLVIGRPVYQAPDPVAVVEAIAESLQD